MFQKLLIANRGEIACRILRTAKRLGVATVAVYSEADADALHVTLADEAWPIGPALARDSYLDMDRIIEVAIRAGAQAVHPGYGFLSENAEFAERCDREGIVFVGPPPRAMRLMGSKAAAKSLVAQVGVPVVPGYHGDDPDDETLAAAAMRIGFPVLVKASAGGGGRGMRVVDDALSFPEAVASARREALAAFGDASVLIEKYLAQPRHVEIQLFADGRGDVIVFPARDCSMQRHHQKIIEETPAPGLTPALGSNLEHAAIAAARAVGYVGAGTAEFLVLAEDFYFLEMNTRLQVEHPVTEMVSGIDLVEWQLRIASGDALPLTQAQLVIHGCAIEARICAEDPARGFLPSTGRIEHYRPPAEAEDIRIDAGVRRGDHISHHYDSLIAKLITWGPDRARAMQKLRAALDHFELVGVVTNLEFLRKLVRHDAFSRGAYDIGFVERELATLNDLTPSPDVMTLLAAGAAARLALSQRVDSGRATEAGDPFSPWAAGDAWRIHGRGTHTAHFEHEGETYSASVEPVGDKVWRFHSMAGVATVSAQQNEGAMRLRIDGVEKRVGVVHVSDGVVIILNGRNHLLRDVDPLNPLSAEATLNGQLSAPVPARVTRVLVETGERVEKGKALVVLEAMKMEFTLIAPCDGVISAVRGVEGEMVMEGEQLVTLSDEAAE